MGAGENVAPGTESVPGLPAALARELEELASRYPKRRAALIPALHRCQEELDGWLSPATLEACARFFGLEPVEVFGVASFYPMFHLAPRGRHLVAVCHNISCQLRGAEEILDEACRVARCAPGSTSDDGRFSVVGVECQGACTAAPMLVLDGAFHENLARSDVARILSAAP
jgi:NADH:ubiquinone oxidoreductase subunit E